MKIAFHGAAGEVTGSCFLVDTGEVRFLVDCGMFQGGAAADAKNRSFAFDPRGIAFVLLTHAHIDHSGLIPRVDGAQSVRLFREEVPVRAMLFTIGGLSAHADRSALLAWLGKFRRAPRQTWVVHGEPLSAYALRDALRADLKWAAEVPERGAEHPLT